MGRASGTASAECADDAVTPGERPLRADAKRNREQLLAAARAAFSERGTAASLEDIARRAQVGVGTLYRHFPTRQALLEAVYVDEVEALCRTAADFGDRDSWDALIAWFDRFVDYVATKKALAEEMMATVGAQAPVFRQCHDAIFTAGEPLLERAKADGAVRSDVEFVDVLRMVSGVCMIRNAESADIRRVLRMALDGLRYQPVD
ncbi:MAG TPA: helix-turn-helix domain-containing protein [Jatrophihabitans sp.]|nr:helix-turn-helix domain-containing protein [Jatrophihabitans sp.]